MIQSTVALLCLGFFATFISIECTQSHWYCWEDVLTQGVIHELRYRLVVVEIDDSLKLYCRTCNATDPFGKDITWQRHDIKTNLTSISSFKKLPNNKSKNKYISINDDTYALVISKVISKHDALYQCLIEDIEANVTEHYNYLLNVVDPTDFPNREGTIKNWIEYRDEIINPTKTEITSRITDFKVDLIFDWTNWTMCMCGLSKLRSRKFRMAFCVMRIEIDQEMNVTLSCRSMYLEQSFPLIYSYSKTLPNFECHERCMEYCVPDAVLKKVKYKMKQTFYLKEGNHIVLHCPGSENATEDTDIIWVRNEKTILNGSKIDGRHLHIDKHQTLYLSKLTTEQQAFYSCSIDGLPIAKFQIIVQKVLVIQTKECKRSFKIISCIILISFVVYCVKMYQILRGQRVNQFQYENIE